MERIGFSFNMRICIGCGACQVACKDANNLNAGEFNRRVSTIAVECADGIKNYHFSGACNHCVEAICAHVCPTGAMHASIDGTIRHNSGQCIGCGACMWSCPYGAISFSKSRGVAQKCESCFERRDIGLLPACVAACVTHAIEFGRVDEPKEGYTALKLPFLPPPEGTQPSTLVRVPDDL